MEPESNSEKFFFCSFLLDSIEELLCPDRFTQVSVHPCIEAPPAITAGRESCEGNDRNVPAPFLLPYTNGGCRLESIHFRHLYVHQNAVEWTTLQSIQHAIPFPASLTSWPRFSSSSMTICRLTGLSS